MARLKISVLVIAAAIAAALIALQRQSATGSERVERFEPAREAPRIESALPLEPVFTQVATVERARRIEPHPITDERRAIDRQRKLFIAIETALDRGNLMRARGLLREHRATYSDDEAWLDFREGFETIADCKEQPGPAATQRALRFINEQSGSTLRRRVRRACLGPRRPATER